MIAMLHQMVVPKPIDEPEKGNVHKQASQEVVVYEIHRR